MTPLALLLLAATPITPARYERDLRAGEALFRGGPTPTAARTYAARISPVTVHMTEGDITVRDAWLQDAVRNYAENTDAKEREEMATDIADHLAARADEVDTEGAAAEPGPATGPTPGTGDTEGAAVLEEILAKDDFQAGSDAPALTQAAARVRTWMRERWTDVKRTWRRMFDPDAQQSGSAWDTIRGWLTLFAAGGAFIVILVLILRTLMRTLSVDAGDVEPAPDLPEEPPEPREMAAAARALATDGDLRSAARAIYLALLGALHEQGRIRYDKHRTNREYLRDLRGRPEREPFAEAVELFDRKWYGLQACTPEEFERMQALYDALAAPDREAA